MKTSSQNSNHRKTTGSLALRISFLLIAGLRFLPSAYATQAFPLKSLPGAHYLVDQNNNPFFVQGDSPWFLTESLNGSDVDYYLSNRWVQGYNSIMLDLTALPDVDGQSFQGNIYGQLPFTNTLSTGYRDLLSWNVAYFTNVDAVIHRAGYYGINVFAYPLYDGFGGVDWYSQMTGNSSNALWSYGNFIGNRYKSFTNIVWIGAGDDNEPNAPNACLWNIIAAGIKSSDPNHLISAQAARPTPALYYSAFVTLNSSYGSQFPYIESLANYQRTPVLPSYAREPYYEHRNITGTPYTAIDCRHFAYWAVFSGDMGHFYGDEMQWPFAAGWQSEMWDSGATTITNVLKLINTRPWWNCVPDSSHTTVVGGFGSSGTGNYVVATREATGKSVLVYIPQGTMQPTVDLSRVSGTSANAWWYSPISGAASSVGTFATSGTKTFSPPDANDWVLVLDDASQALGPPGGTTGRSTITSFSASPSSITSGSASTLSWLVSGSPTPVVTIDHGIGIVQGSSIAVQPTSTTTYTLTASNSLGIATAQASVTVTAADTTPPTVPSNLTVTFTSSSQINLSWTASTDNQGVAGYKIYRNATQVASSAGAFYSDTGLAASTTYSYTVAAFDAAGNVSAQSTPVSATTSAQTSSPPTFVQSSGKIDDSSASSITQGFASANTSGNLIAVVISWGTSTAAPTVADTAGNVYTQAISTYSSAGDQSLAVFYAKNIKGSANSVTVNFGGNHAWRRILIAEYRGLDPVNPLDGAVANQGHATTATDGVTSGSISTTSAGDMIFGAVENYNAAGTVAPGTAFTMRNFLNYGSVIETAFEDRLQGSSGPVSATFTFTHPDTYIVQLVAFRPAATSDNTAPSAPANLLATAISPSQVNLSWSASTDNVAVAGYQIFRNQVKLTTSTSTSYSDTGVQGSTTYTYTVAAFDTAGNSSSQSAPFTVRTPASSSAPAVTSFSSSPSVITNSGSVTLSWSVSGNPNPSLFIAPGVGPVTGNSISVSPTSTTTYTISATNSAGTASAQTTVTVKDTIAPSVPANLAAKPSSSSQINLAWTTSTDNRGVAGYKIFRNATQVATSAAASYSDTGLSASTTYNYTVAAFDAAGNGSAQSTPAAATTSAQTSSPPAFVQSSSKIDDSSSSLISQSFTSANTVGNLIAVVTSWGTSTAAPTVTDTAGNVYTQAISTYSSAGDQSLAVFYAKNIKGSANSVTVNFGGNHAWRRILIAEYRGLDPVNPLDGAIANQGPGTTATDGVTSGSISTGSAGDLIFGAVENYYAIGTVAPGTAFTMRNSLNYGSAIETAFEDRLQTASGPIAATFTFTHADTYIAQLVAFRPIVSP